jgi:hypothetical protein
MLRPTIYAPSRELKLSQARTGPPTATASKPVVKEPRTEPEGETERSPAPLLTAV